MDKKDTVRLSFDVPFDEHILYKTESVKSRMAIKDFLHQLVVLGMKEYQKAQFKEKMQEAIEQARKGEVTPLSLNELDSWEKELSDE